MDRFVNRHIGPSPSDLAPMLKEIGAESVDELINQTVPEKIRLKSSLNIPEAISEDLHLAKASRLAQMNDVYTSYIGAGYYDTITPPVILRNILENPGWYTQYTPYQAEIAQGRLEALLNYQTMVIDLTGLPIANASLLDEATAGAEAMAMMYAEKRQKRKALFLSEKCHPQTIAVVSTRAIPHGINVVIGNHENFEVTEDVFGAILQYPLTDGVICDYSEFCNQVHEQGGLVAVAADILALTLLKPPGEFGSDIAFGSTQRFGVPLGYGGPHAAYLATTEAFKRKMPGRIIGLSQDSNGNPALRMALQTREQHIRREKATSNICTAQVLLAVIAGMYAVYHGKEGITDIANRIHQFTNALLDALSNHGIKHHGDQVFDTFRVDVDDIAKVKARAEDAKINLRYFDDSSVGVSLDERTSVGDLVLLARIITGKDLQVAEVDSKIPSALKRTSDFLTHPVFENYHSETEMMRYLHRLESRDLSLNTSMIPLGSCTMKLNAAAEMIPVTNAQYGRVHPFAPVEQNAGYTQVFEELSNWLGEISGLPGVSLQPNSGAQGEYAGLLVIRQFHLSNGGADRNVCLIPSSAHGTNPASAVMAGMKVVIVKCDDQGNIDVEDLQAKAEEHSEHLSSLMITYPSTHGVFEETVEDICKIIHDNGGLVYMDGANMNAQVGLCRPGDIGADVCHINLHKTFSIPHGGGGPGMGPICVTKELTDYLPGHPIIPECGSENLGPVSAAPWGSASILLISWGYIAMLGKEGIRKATEAAILNANYMASKLEGYYDVLYKGKTGRVAHEFIIDLRPIKKDTGISEVDVAKRLMDYGYHAPTMSWPVPGTMMIEPTESESKREMDRFCEAMISIRAEIEEVHLGKADPENNVLKNAPHTVAVATKEEWDLPYSREKAAFPSASSKDHKFWPHVGRVDNALGDRNLVCACPPIEEYQD